MIFSGKARSMNDPLAIVIVVTITAPHSRTKIIPLSETYYLDYVGNAAGLGFGPPWKLKSKLGGLDSNQDIILQRDEYYRYTTSQLRLQIKTR